jgi:hypothetical protein
MVTGVPPLGGSISIAPAASCAGCAFDPVAHMMYVGMLTNSPGLMARVNTDTGLLDSTCSFVGTSGWSAAGGVLLCGGYAVTYPRTTTTGSQVCMRVPTNNFVPGATQSIDLTAISGANIVNASSSCQGAVTDGVRYVYLAWSNTGAGAAKAIIVRVDMQNFTVAGCSFVDLTNRLAGAGAATGCFTPAWVDGVIYFNIRYSAGSIFALAWIDPAVWNAASARIGPTWSPVTLGLSGTFFVGREYIWNSPNNSSGMLIPFDKRGCSQVSPGYTVVNQTGGTTVPWFYDGKRYGYFTNGGSNIRVVDEANPGMELYFPLNVYDAGWTGTSGQPAADNQGNLYWAPNSTGNLVYTQLLRQRLMLGARTAL